MTTAILTTTATATATTTTITTTTTTAKLPMLYSMVRGTWPR